MKDFKVLEMKIVIDCKKKNNGETYTTPRRIRGNLPLITSKILDYGTNEMNITCRM